MVRCSRHELGTDDGKVENPTAMFMDIYTMPHDTISANQDTITVLFSQGDNTAVQSLEHKPIFMG